MYKNLSPADLGVSGRQSEIIELALSHGFKGLELNLDEFTEQVATQGFDKASRLIKSARLKLGSFPLPVRWQDDSPDYPADLERLPTVLGAARQIGCRRAITTISPGSDRAYHENFEFHRQRLGELGDLLASHEIQLGVGFLAPAACRPDRAFPFVRTADEMLLLLGTITSPNVGLALDTWHWHLGGGTLDQLRALDGQKIVDVRLADAEAELTADSAELSARLLPGAAATIDNAAVLNALGQLGYDGPATPVASSSQFAGRSRDEIVKTAAAAFDEAWKAAGLTPAGRLATVSGS